MVYISVRQQGVADIRTSSAPSTEEDLRTSEPLFISLPLRPLRSRRSVDCEQCPICMLAVTDKSSPETCSHVFCECCLSRWAQVTATCPLCKSAFRRMRVQRGGADAVLVSLPEVRGGEEEEEEGCEICGSDEQEHLLLLCDKCDKMHHTFCLLPPLERVPDGNWYCPTCAAALEDRFSEEESRGSSDSSPVSCGPRGSRAVAKRGVAAADSIPTSKRFKTFTPPSQLVTDEFAAKYLNEPTKRSLPSSWTASRTSAAKKRF
eukprot:GILJ01003984.1.p1 GENE.GILJ01003984.1~~GILJ01003984.1.p1  ORF type:complete len:262 (-),score=24.38 GILJ01003984.1:383-1168(-)